MPGVPWISGDLLSLYVTKRVEFAMRILPILPKHGGVEKWCRAHLHNGQLPAFYMGDFSVMGLMVERVGDTIDALQKRGLPIRQDGDLASADIADLGHLKRMLKILDENGVDYQLSDIAHQIYQG
jgi:hypothetical protein